MRLGHMCLKLYFLGKIFAHLLLFNTSFLLMKLSTTLIEGHLEYGL